MDTAANLVVAAEPLGEVGVGWPVFEFVQVPVSAALLVELEKFALCHSLLAPVRALQDLQWALQMGAFTQKIEHLMAPAGPQTTAVPS